MTIQLNQAYSYCQLGQRANQEDARYPDLDKPAADQRFFVVCDGVGGEEKGEVASRTVCDAIAAALAGRDWGTLFGYDDFALCLQAAYTALDRRANAANKGMATTMTFLAVHGEGALVAHIGDSRIYHVRPSSGILYRSDDHSLVNAMVHSGVITPDEAIGHPNDNIITRSMTARAEGSERAKATVMQLDDIAAGDYFILCTDGVLHQVTDEQICAVLADAALADEQKCRRLAQLTAESADNNTLYLIPVAQVVTEEQPIEVPQPDDDGASTTRRIERPAASREVTTAATATPSVGQRIKDFFKRLNNA